MSSNVEEYLHNGCSSRSCQWTSAPDKSLLVNLILKSAAYFLDAMFIKSRSDTPRNDGNKTNYNAKIGAVSHHLGLLCTTFLLSHYVYFFYKLIVMSLYLILIDGVDTFAQGTVVQGPLCPRDISPRRLLSKETLVQGDISPRRLLSKVKVWNIKGCSYYFFVIL